MSEVTGAFGPGSDEYAAATTPRNQISRQQPAAAVIAHSGDDVAKAVRAARESGLRVAVQATGHGSDSPIGADTLLIDTSGLDAVEVDPEQRTVRVGAGATFGAINGAAFDHGLLAPGGSAPDVGVTGYVALGGVGWLTRPHGLAAASLVSVDIVDGSGSRLHADEQTNADVLWAYRGGGGVGIATSLVLRLYPAADLQAGYVLWEIEHASAVISAWADALDTLDPALSSSMGLLHAPAAPMVPEPLQGRRVVHLSAATVGGAAAMQTLRNVLATLPEPALNTLGPSDATRLTGIHLDPPKPVPAVGEGRWLRRCDGATATRILTAAGIEADSPIAEIELRHTASPTSDVPGAMTSCPSEIALHATGPAPDANARATVAAAHRVVLDAAQPVDLGHGAPSFRDGQRPSADSLPAEVLDRLRTVRDAVDPDRVIWPSKLLRTGSDHAR